MKKTLKIIGLAVVTAILVFFSMGLFNSEITYEAEISVNKPLPEVFALFNDPNSLSKWIPTIKKFEVIELKPGLTGSRYSMEVHDNGEIFQMTETITAFEYNKSVAIEIDAGMMLKTNSFTFADENGATRIRADYSAKGQNLFAKSMFVFFKTMFREIDLEYLNNFKEFAESQ